MDKTTTTMSNKDIESYLKSLNNLEKQTLDIAKSHLGTSFNVRKSIGFIKWKQAIIETNNIIKSA
jgi:hypothetical protein